MRTLDPQARSPKSALAEAPRVVRVPIDRCRRTPWAAPLIETGVYDTKFTDLSRRFCGVKVLKIEAGQIFSMRRTT